LASDLSATYLTVNLGRAAARDTTASAIQFHITSTVVWCRQGFST